MNAVLAEISIPLGNLRLTVDAQRDRRVMNHMDPETKAVHIRLSEWGRWAAGDCTGVEWPRSTLLGRVIKQGLTGAAQTGSGPVSVSEDVALTDAAVGRLGVIDHAVIREYYLREGPEEMIWKNCRGIRSLANFKIVLKRARWRVAGFIDGFRHRL